MKNTKLAFQWASILAITASSVALGQYFPPSGGGTGPTTNPVSIAQGGTGSATAPANTVFGNNTGSTAAPAYFTLPAGGVVSSTQYQVATYLTTGASVTGSPQFTNNAGNVTFGDATHAGTLTVETGAGNWTEFQTGASQVSNVSVNWPITNGAVGQLMCPQDSLGDLLWETLSGDITIAKNGATTLKNTGAGAGSATAANITVDAQGRVTAYSNGGAGGTVTSVTFTGDGTVLSSTPSTAVTTSGTVLGTLLTQAKNVIFAGPGSGANAAPTFRALVAADMPSTTVNSTGNLSPLFTSSISAQALSFSLSNTANAAWFGATSATAPSFQAGALPISLGGTDNASLAVTAGGIVYTDGTKLQNTGAGSPGNVLTYPASGTVPIWQAPTSGSIGGSIANDQVAFGSGANTISGSGSFEYNSGSTILEIGDPGVGTLMLLNTNGTGTVSLQPSTNSFGAITFTLPQVAVTEVASAAGVNNAVVLQSTAGARSTSLAPYAPGFAGLGGDGATTTWTNPVINATTIAVSASTGPTIYGSITINATSTAAFNSGAVISTAGLGYAGARSGGTSTAAFTNNGSGPYPGLGTINGVANGGGGGSGAYGAGGKGGAGTMINGGLGGNTPTSNCFMMGSGGGGTATAGGTGLAGAAGGGLIRICAAGALTTASGASITVNGAAGTNSTTATDGGSGGGGAGSIIFSSLTSCNIAAATATAIGGAGGNGDTTGDGGGGGGGGFIGIVSPSNTNSLVTANACTGGGGGTTGTGSVGTAGSVGNVVAIAETPTDNMLAMLEQGGWKRIVDRCKENKVIASIHGYDLGQVQAARYAAVDINQYQIAMATYKSNDVTHSTVWVIEFADKARREDVA